jgi:glutathione S-transferase
MPQIETKNENVQQLAGLHLYHDPLSSCAMRVRIVLAEKKLPWQSHVIDLAKMEHALRSINQSIPTGSSRRSSMMGALTLKQSTSFNI